MKHPFLLGTFLLAMGLASSTLASDPNQLSVYFIGNSLTMSSTLDRVHGLFEQRDLDLQFGSQVSAGKSLLRHLKYKDEPTQKWICWETSEPAGKTFAPHPNFYVVDPKTWRFGRYDTALVSHKWDAVVFQPYLSSIRDDMEAIPAFIQLALQNNAADQFYIYQTWPRRPKAKAASGNDPDSAVAQDIDYPTLWTSKYTATIEEIGWKANANCASRDYYQILLKMLSEKCPEVKKPIKLIPVGEVLFVIDEKIKKGQLPGLKELAERDPSMIPGLREGTDFSKGVNVLYADAVHFNPMPHQKGVVGNLISGTTIFTVLSGQNPVGLSAASYGFDQKLDGELVKAIQQTIWDVVTAEPATGIKR